MPAHMRLQALSRATEMVLRCLAASVAAAHDAGAWSAVETIATVDPRHRPPAPALAGDAISLGYFLSCAAQLDGFAACYQLCEAQPEAMLQAPAGQRWNMLTVSSTTSRRGAAAQHVPHADVQISDEALRRVTEAALDWKARALDAPQCVLGRPGIGGVDLGGFVCTTLCATAGP